MSRHKIIAVSFLILLALLIALPLFASAIGVAPGHVDINYKEGAEESVTIKIINREGAPVRVTLGAMGELESGIKFPEPSFVMGEGETERLITFKLSMPRVMDKPGTHTTSIIITSTPESQSGAGGMTASVAVLCQLNLIVPYPGRYAELTLHAPLFETGERNSFVADVRNLGTEDLTEARLVIDIYGPGQEKVASLSSEPFILRAKESKPITIQWTPSVEAGSYRAEAALIFEGGNAADSIDITVGEMEIEFSDIQARPFKFGDIAALDIFIQSRWNQDIPGVYIDAKVEDMDGASYASYTTSTISLKPKEKQVLPVYWDTRSATPGDYVLKLVLNYMGKTQEQDVKLKVSLDKIETDWSGYVVSGIQSEEEKPIVKWMVLLSFIIAALIGFNIFLYVRFAKKKHGK